MSTTLNAAAHQENAAVVPYGTGRKFDLNNAEPQRPEYYGGNSRDDDTQELIERLKERAGQWIPELFPAGRYTPDRSEWRLANIGGLAPRKDGSCKIALVGEHAGEWYDFSPTLGGGPIQAIAEATGLSGVALFDKAPHC